MSLPYDPFDWYWRVGGSSTQVYSSRVDNYVAVADSNYAAWVTAGGVVKDVSSESEVGAELAQTFQTPNVAAAGVRTAYYSALNRFTNSGALWIRGNLVSTTPATGALLVDGGVGILGAINAGDRIRTKQVTNLAGNGLTVERSDTTDHYDCYIDANNGFIIQYNSGAFVRVASNGGFTLNTNSAPDNAGGLLATGIIRTTDATASTSTTTGSLRAAGGAGIVGDINAGGAIKSSGGGLGYATGAGGTVTQATSPTNAVTLNKLCGQITTQVMTTAAGAATNFNLMNSFIADGDLVVLNMYSTNGSTGMPIVQALTPFTGQVTIRVHNVHASAALNAALVINFAVIKGVYA